MNLFLQHEIMKNGWNSHCYMREHQDLPEIKIFYRYRTKNTAHKKSKSLELFTLCGLLDHIVSMRTRSYHGSRYRCSLNRDCGKQCMHTSCLKFGTACQNLMEVAQKIYFHLHFSFFYLKRLFARYISSLTVVPVTWSVYWQVSILVVVTLYGLGTA